MYSGINRSPTWRECRLKARLDDTMFQEPGCNTEWDYVEQSSWMLFFKYLGDQERNRAVEAQLLGKPYDFLFEEQFRWSEWAAPKAAEGSPIWTARGSAAIWWSL